MLQSRLPQHQSSTALVAGRRVADQENMSTSEPKVWGGESSATSPLKTTVSFDRTTAVQYLSTLSHLIVVVVFFSSHLSILLPRYTEHAQLGPSARQGTLTLTELQLLHVAHAHTHTHTSSCQRLFPPGLSAATGRRSSHAGLFGAGEFPPALESPIISSISTTATTPAGARQSGSTVVVLVVVVVSVRAKRPAAQDPRLPRQHHQHLFSSSSSSQLVSTNTSTPVPIIL